MSATSKPADGLRAITREAVRERIAGQAMILFDENGFENTTVEDIAKAVGISLRSYFRYYSSKEDVVIGDLVIGSTGLRDAVAHHLDEMTPWQALRHVMREGAAEIDADPLRQLRQLRMMRVIYTSAALRARSVEKHLTWSALLVPLVNGHMGSDPRFGDLPARTVVGNAFACLDAALLSWTEGKAAHPLADVIDAAFDAAETGRR